jgi:hypothetical protein
MLMLYTYNVMILVEEWPPSHNYSFDRIFSIIADTKDDRRAILENRFDICGEGSDLIKHVLISARALTLDEISLLETTTRHNRTPPRLYLLYVKNTDSTLARYPRIVTTEYVSVGLRRSAPSLSCAVSFCED